MIFVFGGGVFVSAIGVGITGAESVRGVSAVTIWTGAPTMMVIRHKTISLRHGAVTDLKEIADRYCDRSNDVESGVRVEIKEFTGSKWEWIGRMGTVIDADMHCLKVKTDDGEEIRDVLEHFRTK